MSTEAFKARSGAKLVKLALQSGASIVGKSGGLCQDNQSMRQEGTSEVSAAKKLSVIPNYELDLSDYLLDLSDYIGMSNVPSNACIA